MAEKQKKGVARVWVVISLWIILWIVFVGCGNKAEFEIAITNRVYCQIEVYLNGDFLGLVAPVSAAKFTKEIEVDKDSPVNAANQASYAWVTFVAKSVPQSSLTRQSISRSIGMWIYDDRVNHVEWDYGDFDPYIRNGVLLFNFVMRNQTQNLLLIKINGDSSLQLQAQTETSIKKQLQCFWIDNNGIGQAQAVFTATAYLPEGQKKLSRPKIMTVQSNKIESVTFTSTDF